MVPGDVCQQVLVQHHRLQAGAQVRRPVVVPTSTLLVRTAPGHAKPVRAIPHLPHQAQIQPTHSHPVDVLVHLQAAPKVHIACVKAVPGRASPQLRKQQARKQ